MENTVMEINVPVKRGVLKPMSNEARKELDNLMDEAIRVKLSEYEARMAFAEATAAKVMQEFAELKVKQEATEREVQELHRESFKKLLEFTERLTKVNGELAAIENSIHSDEKSIERIREHEEDAVRSVKAEEAKILKKVRKQLTVRKTVDNLLKKLTGGKNKSKFYRTVREASASVKARTALVNALLKDKKLRAKLVADLSAGTRGKLKREKVTARVAKVAVKKVIKAVKPKVKKAAKTAAKKAVKTEAKK